MAELIAGIIAYNEEELLPRCLESIKGKVDRIILVEGRIDAFPGDAVRSSDKTLQIANDYGCEIVTNQIPWANEAFMRSQYLLGNPDDWYITIDADEKCMTPLPSIADFPAGVDALAIKVVMIGAPVSVWRPRFFRHKGIMEYRQIHDALFSDGKLISRPAGTPQLSSVWFAHYQMNRSKLRRNQKSQYYKTGYAHEPQYRQEWRMFNVG